MTNIDEAADINAAQGSADDNSDEQEPVAGLPFAKPNKKALVVRRNELIFGRTKMSLQETRLFLWLVSEIKKGDEDFRPYRISVRDFCDLVGLEGDNMFSELKSITRRMISRVVEINDPTASKTGQYALVSSAVYHNKQGFVDIMLHPELKPFLLEVKAYFTTIELGMAVRLKSPYSVRLYELLKAENFKGDAITFTLDKLRNYLGIEVDQYDRFNNLKARVLDPASEEVDQKTDLGVTYSVSRVGKSVNEVIFNVQKKSVSEDGLTEDQERLMRALRSVGMSETEAFHAVEKWGLSEPQRILWHVQECKKAKIPLAWLRAGLKKDYRPKGLSKEQRAKEKRLEAEERAREQQLKTRAHNGSDGDLFGKILDGMVKSSDTGRGA